MIFFITFVLLFTLYGKKAKDILISGFKNRYFSIIKLAMFPVQKGGIANFFLKRAKLIALVIKLKQHYISGYIPGVNKYYCGLSKTTYLKLFSAAVESGIIRKVKRGYVPIHFKEALKILFGNSGYYISIWDKKGSFNSLTHNILNSLTLHRIQQQFHTTRLQILEQHGKSSKKYWREFLKEGSLMVSARSIGRFLGVSHVIANACLNKLKRMAVIKLKKIDRAILRKLSLKVGYWHCERFVLDVIKIQHEQIQSKVLCKFISA